MVNNMKKQKLYIIVPCFNEEEVLKEFNKSSVEKQKSIISKQNVACFTYDLAEDIQGNVGDEDGILMEKQVM